MTSPVSLAGATGPELEGFLREEGVLESEEDGKKREETLRKLEAIVKCWIPHVAIKRNMPEDKADAVGGK